MTRQGYSRYKISAPKLVSLSWCLRASQDLLHAFLCWLSPNLWNWLVELLVKNYLSSQAALETGEWHLDESSTVESFSLNPIRITSITKDRSQDVEFSWECVQDYQTLRGLPRIYTPAVCQRTCKPPQFSFVFSVCWASVRISAAMQLTGWWNQIH